MLNVEHNYLLTIWHLIFTLFAFILIIVSCVLFKKYGKGKELKTLKVYSWVLLIAEVFKILYHIFVLHAKFTNYAPLYYCSLAIYATFFAAYGKNKLKKLGECFLVYGGIVSGIAFLIYPSTALGIHPIYHPLTIHSMLYHSSCAFLGIMLLIHNYVTLKHRDIINYSLFAGSFMIFCHILNVCFSLNFMFLRLPDGIKPLEFLYKTVGKYFYPIFIALGQLLATFYITFGIYKLINIIQNRKTKKTTENEKSI